jgi:hypothetical protein
MVFTRHFYEIDEVCGALQHSVLNGRVRDAFFWVQELTDSEENVVCFRTLLETWLLFYGGAFPEWLSAAKRSWKGEQMSGLELALNLSLCNRKDISVIHALCLTEEPVERILSDGSLEGYLKMSIAQGRSRSAIWAAATIDNLDRIWKLLPNEIVWLSEIFKDKSDIWFVYALIVALCTEQRLKKSERVIWKPLSREMTDEVDSWITVLGRRDRRKFSIPAGQLCGVGGRWKIDRRSSNLKRLYNFEKSISQDGSGFWFKALTKSKWSVESGWNGDDDALEEFYEEYFPDDIPDEWSLEEKKKSHGSGYLREVGEEISGGRWSRSWLSDSWRAASVWGQEGEVTNKLWSMKIKSSLSRAFQDIVFWKPENMKKYLMPVKRKYETDQ